ncbi:VCBS repeat-containing protein [Croceivirga thetidis]|uniref:VCBS repeat-containing protein n=1 Tax=Croceivirga thetidis TaxID=2721623 RepID=A0ABX1GWZ4_9FLAO|nr:VCBS repeat-containing protein [Croceivirga thetidis]NKI33237.1 VCBS repeat-containing protein [Croceivirga thetidis]
MNLSPNIFWYCTLFSLFIIFCGCKNKSDFDESQVNSDKKMESNKVFERIPSEESNLLFQNNIQENLETKENLFNYDYFYNGAGVGIADLNNDGLNDIFFCGNQVENKLFFNKGELTFEDISNVARINDNKTWSNGVTFVDINNDDWLDIYISQGGPFPREQRKNLLYLNQKNGTFTEIAENVGLADEGVSTQSVFFDYDNDGDLDCLVMNENEIYGVDPINLYKIIEQDTDARRYNSSHLYRNDNGKFIEVTKIAGVERPIFGLGVTVSDINEDGWLDFYIASDYFIPDAMFINNQDGTFTDRIKEYTQQISFFGMGMDFADINNDLKQDFFVLDMAADDHIRSKTLMASMNTGRFNYLINTAGFHHQYMYNSLQLRTAKDKFTNISQATSMANSDWSWSVLMSDFDHDTNKDIYVTNGYRRYALDNDLQLKVYESKLKYKGQVPLSVKKQLYESMPSEKLPNILYQNSGNLNFKNAAKEWGLGDYSFSNGAAQGDLDNDGDLDLVVNNMDENCFLYRNMTTENGGVNYLKIKPKGRLSESFATVTITYDDQSQMNETRRVRGYRSAQENIAHFGLGNHSIVDTIRVKWPSGLVETRFNIKANQTLVFTEEDATEKVLDKTADAIFKEIENSNVGLDFEHSENFYDDFEKEILLPYKQSTLGPFIARGDVNGDTLEDLFVGGASGQSSALFIQNTNGSFEKRKNQAFEDDRTYEDMQSVFFDVDLDGDLDLFVVSGGNEFSNYSTLYADRLYLNNGKGNFVKANIDVLNSNPKSGRSVDLIDYDEDGDLDILVGNRIIPQSYPHSAPSTLWKNDHGQLVDVTKEIAPELLDFGIINDIVVTDFNSDGKQDFIAVGEWSEIGFFRNNQGKFGKVELPGQLEQTKGWWYSIEETDINNDNLPDYVLGNVGLNIKFKASKKKPFKVFATDFDENGTPDIVLSKQYNGEYVPVRGRECSSQQMPFIKQKFETYSEFANANLVDIYGEKLNYAYEAEVNELKSILLINKGNGEFNKVELPFEAQLFPVLNMEFEDFNKDGNEDVLLVGNIYETEVETPRLDAFSGLILLSNGKDNYHPMPWTESGIILDGNIKDVSFINTKTGSLLLATQNNGPLLVHKQQ